MPISTPSNYAAWLESLKTQIRTARVKASLAVNRELFLLYWRLGKEIVHQRGAQSWGSKVLENLALDLRSEFPEIKGLSLTYLKFMARFAEAWEEDSIGHQLGAQIPWRHNITIIDQVKDRPTREWYIKKTIENGWSRSVLVMQIESQAHLRLGAAQTNFVNTLPAPQSDLARDLIKAPYIFDFLGLLEPTNKRQIENALINNLKDFLIELGVAKNTPLWNMPCRA